MTKKVIELIRVSTLLQAADDRASIPAQRAINRKTARAHDLDIVRSVEIEDVSGAMTLAAPEMQELLRAITSPDVHGVVTREFSRLMRPENFNDYILFQAFADTKTILYLPEGPIDLSSMDGKILGTVKAIIAGYELTQIRERIWSAKEEKRRQGKFSQSEVCLPYGVGYTEGDGWYYKPEAERVGEAFRLFAAGENSYITLSRMLGVTPTGLRSILQNPIYTGWRVIDKRRDPSPSARRTKVGGRQGDRPKIMRAPDEVIRVRVIEEPLVTEELFTRVQQIIAIKRERHWKARPNFHHRYTYNGFLTCAICNQPVQTGVMRDDYYVCKAKRKFGRCESSYMRRDQLDPKLDLLFTERLTDQTFLYGLAEEMTQRAENNWNSARHARLEAQIRKLGAKRDRILRTYYDGKINEAKRDDDLDAVDLEVERVQKVLERHRPPITLSAESLSALFSPFLEWKFLERDDKRRILSTIVPEIRIANYKVDGLYLALPVSSNNESRKDKGSSPPRA